MAPPPKAPSSNRSRPGGGGPRRPGTEGGGGRRGSTGDAPGKGRAEDRDRRDDKGRTRVRSEGTPSAERQADAARPDRSRTDRAPAGKGRADSQGRTGRGTDKPRTERRGVEKTGSDKTRSDRPRADRTRTDRTRADGPRSKRPRAHDGRADRSRPDAPRTDRGRSDSPRTDSPRSDRPRADGVRPDRPIGDRPRGDRFRPDGKAPDRGARRTEDSFRSRPVRRPSDKPKAAPSVRAPDRPDGDRIAKLLARAGIASRREIERMIEEGRIALNGVAIETPATILKSLHGITVDGNPVKEPAPARLFLFHKPAGCLTAERDPAGRPTIYDRLPQDVELPRLMPVGRLDYSTEGLLLLTNDGEFKRLLELPSTGVERTYRARAFGEISQDQLEELVMGIEIDGMKYGRIDANLERRTGRNTWVEMTLTEGKNREVRRVLEHFGLEVSRLIRTRYGPFVLGDSPPGALEEVRRHDLIVFRNSLEKAGGKKADK